MAEIIGDSSANTLNGDGENDLIRGLGGNDVIDGGGGNDTIFGGSGTNTLTGGAGNDVFGIEARSVASNGGSQIHDVQDFTIGADKIDLSFLNIASFQTLLPFMRQDLDDLIIEFFNDGYTERFILRDVSLNDISASDFIFNTSSANLTIGITGRDFTDYVLFGGNGDDVITSDRGDDILNGGAGNDEISASFGTNIVRGGSGNDDFNITGRDFFSTNTTIEDFTIGQDQLDVSLLNVSTFADLSNFLTQDGDDVVLQTSFDGGSEIYRFTDTQLSALSASDFIFNTSNAELNVTASGRSFTDYVLFGGGADDEITAFSGDDTIIAGAGDDEISAGYGTNTIQGGAGNDDFNIVARSFNATNTTITDFIIGEDQLDVRIFNVGDLVTLMPYLSQDGDDVVLSTLYDGASEVYRLQNIQLADLTSADFVFNDINADLTVNAAGRSFTDYILFGGNGDDVLNGSGVDSSFAGNNTLNGGAGDDELNGGGDNDILIGGAGADELNGGGGFDQASYITASTGVNINLGTGVTSGDQTVGDTFNDVEGLVGSQFDDVLTGNDIEAGRFDGLAGDDIIVTGESNGNINIVYGGEGNDTITGGSERDRIFGEDGNDIINGGEGRNEIDGGAGDDIISVIRPGDFGATIDGGTGVDTLVLDQGFVFIQAAISSSFDAAFRIGDGVLGDSSARYNFGGSYDNIERIQVEGITFDIDVTNLQRGTNNQQLFLSNESEVVQTSNKDSDVFGLAGNDYIISADGAQRLFGGAGADYLVGNAGNDVLAGDTSVGLSGVEGEVFRAYQAVFDRNPDLNGFNAFVREIRLDNLTQESVIAEFVGSTEFQNTYGTLTNREFMEQLYLNVLDRNGDSAGLDAFTGTLDGGRSRASVVVEFANSAEFLQLMVIPGAAFATNVVFDPVEGEVFRVYQAMLDRAPDDAGFLNFSNSIKANVLTLIDVINEFIDSPEFSATYGSLNNRQFVETLYENVLPGNEDQAGRDAFTAVLDAGTERAAVVEEFANSLEFRTQTNQATLNFVRQVEDGSSGDVLNGGTGDDFLIGGGGDDLFIYDVSNGDQDVIADFVAGDAGGDIIRLSGSSDFDSFAEIMSVASQEGADVFLNFGDGNSLRLSNVNLNDLNEDDFEFISEDPNSASSEVIDNSPLIEGSMDSFTGYFDSGFFG